MGIEKKMPGREYDLFISYAAEDAAWVEGYLLDALKSAGAKVHTEEAFALGAPRVREFNCAIQNAKRTLLVLSPAYLVEHTSHFITLLGQSYGLETNTWPVIPLILKPVAKLPPSLAMLHRLDATDPAKQKAAIERLCDELNVQVRGPLPPPTCPYPGMRPFSEDESKYFFGRDGEIEELVGRLRQHPFIAVIGPSGSGKSSLVFAGLVPALRKSGLFGSGEWLVCTVRPGGEPLAALTNAFGGDLTDPAQAVSRLLNTQPGARRLLLVIDQFEESFTISTQNMEQFQRAVLEFALVPGCYVVLTVRADFYSDLMATPLWSEVQAHRFEIVPLDKDGLRQAIVKPAEDVGMFVEAALVERLVTEAAGEPGILPLLQETLVLLWERPERRFLSLRAYEALGDASHTGMQVAIARHADGVLAALLPNQQDIARRIFLRLIQFGEGRADTRRQQSIGALRTRYDGSRQFGYTLDYLTNNRLLTLSGEEGRVDQRVDIAHESLIAGWPRLEQWTNEWREAEQTRRRMDAKTTEWVRLRASGGGLLDEAELAEAERWLNSPDAQEVGYNQELRRLVRISKRYIEEKRRDEIRRAEELAEEQRRRAEDAKRSAAQLRRRAIWLSVFLIVACAGLALASWFANRAQQSAVRELVARQTSEAQSTRAIQAESVAQAAAAQEATAAADAQAKATQAAISGAIAQTAAAAEATARANAENDAEWARNAQATSIAAEATAVADRASAQVAAALEANARATAQAAGATAVAEQAIAETEEARAVAAEQVAATQAAHAIAERAIAETARAEAEAEATRAAAAEAAAVAEARLATSRQLAAQSLNLLGDQSDPVDDQFYLSLLLSLEASRIADTAEARNSLLTALQQYPRLVTFLREHTSRVRSVAFSSDGKILAWGCENGTIRLWDVVTGQFVGPPLIGHKGDVWSVAFRPNSTILASGGNDTKIILWDVSDLPHSPVVSQTLAGHKSTVLSVAFSPDDETLASGSTDDAIILWDVPDVLNAGVAASQPFSKTLTDHDRNVYSVAFSPDGKTLASGDRGGKILLWEVSDWVNSQVSSWELSDLNAAVKSVAFSPIDDKILASGDIDGTVILWDMTPSPPISQPLTGHSDYVDSVAFSPDGRTLASGSRDKTIILWDVSDWTNLHVLGQPLTGHADVLRSVAFSPDGKLLASGSEDATVGLWDVDPSHILTYPKEVWSVAFSPDGGMLAAGGTDNTIILWDVVTGQPIGQPLTGHTNRVRSVAFGPNGDLASGGLDDPTVLLWNEITGQPISRTLPAQTASVLGVAFSRDGMLASGDWDGTVRLWNVTTGLPIGQPLTGHDDKVTSVAFSSDGATLASGSWDNNVILWNQITGQPISQTLTGYGAEVHSVAISSDNVLASGDADGAVFLWDVAASQPIGLPLAGHPRQQDESQDVYSVAFSPDGNILASGSRDRTIILWDLSIGRSIGQPFIGHTDRVTSVAFSPDGKTLASGSVDCTVRLWDMDWRERACRIVRRNLTPDEIKQYITNPDLWPTEQDPPPCDEYPFELPDQE